MSEDTIEFQQFTTRLAKQLNKELIRNTRLTILKLCPLVGELETNKKKIIRIQINKPHNNLIAHYKIKLNSMDLKWLKLKQKQTFSIWKPLKKINLRVKYRCTFSTLVRNQNRFSCCGWRESQWSIDGETEGRYWEECGIGSMQNWTPWNWRRIREPPSNLCNIPLINHKPGCGALKTKDKLIIMSALIHHVQCTLFMIHTYVVAFINLLRTVSFRYNTKLMLNLQLLQRYWCSHFCHLANKTTICDYSRNFSNLFLELGVWKDTGGQVPCFPVWRRGTSLQSWIHRLGAFGGRVCEDLQGGEQDFGPGVSCHLGGRTGDWEPVPYPMETLVSAESLSNWIWLARHTLSTVLGHTAINVTVWEQTHRSLYSYIGRGSDKFKCPWSNKSNN